MSDQSIPHFRPATLPGQFPESDVRGAAAREAANGREKHPSWEQQRRERRITQGQADTRPTERLGAEQQQQQDEQQLRDELDVLNSDDEIKRQLRRYMWTFDAATAGDMIISDATAQALRCHDFDLLGLIIRVCALTETVANAVEAERGRGMTPVTSPFTSRASVEVMPGSSHAAVGSSSPSPSNNGSRPLVEIVQIQSLEPVADYAPESTGTTETPPSPIPVKRARARRMTTPAARGPVVTRSGRTVKPAKRLGD